MTALLSGKVAAVTGGLTGIGRAIAVEFVKQHAKVVVNHVGHKTAEADFKGMVSELETAGFRDCLVQVKGDITQPDASEEMVQTAVSTFGKLDIFVSNAGICQFADFLNLEKELFDRTVSVNLSGAFYATQAAARQMVKQGHGGSIIGVSSISALVGGGLQTHYTPTKAGILSLMQSCAVALGKYSIRCNALLPGTIRTQLNEEDLANDEKRRYMEGRIPLGRTGIPHDLAGPAVFLASDLSQYVTGSQLLVDGGLFVNLQ